MDTVSVFLLVFITFCWGMLAGVGLCMLADSLKSEKDGRPIIRHCKNCKWGEDCLSCVNCTVNYKVIYGSRHRKKALFCRFFKKKEGGK